MPTVNTNCLSCGKSITRYLKPSKFPMKKGLYCDRQCVSDYFKGPGNPMRNLEIAAKQSKTRIQMFENHPEMKANIAAKVSENWARGDYDGVRVGQCKWHDLTLANGRVIKLQGSWEYGYAKYLDEQQIYFEVHVGRIPYIDDEGVCRNYYPDFKMEDGSYEDVKNPLYEVEHARKLELVRQQNNVKVTIINRTKLVEIGVLTKSLQPQNQYRPVGLYVD